MLKELKVAEGISEVAYLNGIIAMCENYYKDKRTLIFDLDIDEEVVKGVKKMIKEKGNITHIQGGYIRLVNLVLKKVGTERALKFIEVLKGYPEIYVDLYNSLNEGNSTNAVMHAFLKMGVEDKLCDPKFLTKISSDIKSNRVILDMALNEANHYEVVTRSGKRRIRAMLVEYLILARHSSTFQGIIDGESLKMILKQIYTPGNLLRTIREINVNYTSFQVRKNGHHYHNSIFLEHIKHYEIIIAIQEFIIEDLKEEELYNFLKNSYYYYQRSESRKAISVVNEIFNDTFIEGLKGKFGTETVIRYVMEFDLTK